MKNPYEVLRSKEQERDRLRREVEALKIAAQLLGDEDEAAREEQRIDLN
jgi:hypothetical protein